MKKIIIMFSIALFCFSFCLPVIASPSVNFVATNTYWEDTNKLAIEGYFVNDTDSAVIGISYFGLAVYYFDNIAKTYYNLTEGVWENGAPYNLEAAYNLNAFSDKLPITEAYIYPGNTSYWKFVLPTSAMVSLEHYQYVFDLGCNLVR